MAKQAVTQEDSYPINWKFGCSFSQNENSDNKLFPLLCFKKTTPKTNKGCRSAFSLFKQAAI